MTKRNLVFVVILVVGLIGGGVISCTSSSEEFEDYGLAPDQRYHDIHTTEQSLECATCHVSEPDTTQTVFTAQDVSPRAPNPVDKKACLRCHRDGPGRNLYQADGS